MPTLELKPLKGYTAAIEDNKIYGYSFIKIFLENLSLEDKQVSKQRGYEVFNWKEKDQKNNEENNQYILKALNRTIRKMNRDKNKELIKFSQLLKSYTKKID